MKRAAVLMTARDTAAYIGEAVHSVYASIAQVAGWDVQLLIAVDDCPETRRTLTLLGHAHWYTTEQVGTFVLRNSLASLAGAVDALVSFDSDDVMSPLYLAALLAAMQPDRLIGTARYEVNERLEHGYPTRTTAWACVGGSCALGIEAWQRLGGYWTAHRVGMDTELCDRARKAGLPWVAVERPLFLRRRNPRSLTQGFLTSFGSAQRQAALVDIETRRADRALVYVEPEMAPLRFWSAGDGCPR